MKRIGLIGGLGPESTLDYYKEIINAFKTGEDDLNYPEILIYSVKLSEFLSLMKIRAYDKIVPLLLDKINALQRAGADFAAITANTPHMFYNAISEKSPLPMISIVEATCQETIRRGLKKPGLFGTGFTMSSTFYQEVFNRFKIPIVLPDQDEREILDQKLFSEIELGIFRDETRNLLLEIVKRMVKEEHIDSLILGCTEFPLIFTEPLYAGIPMLNTTKIHVDAIVKECLGTDKK
jgi:aspartate racemase